MPLQRRLLGVGSEKPSDFERNDDSSQARGLVLWVPGTSLHARDYTNRFSVTLDVAVISAIAPRHGPIWELTDSSPFAIVEGSADGVLDFGLADPFTISMWVDLPNINGTLISKAGSTGGQRQIQLFVGGGSDLACRLHGSSSIVWSRSIQGVGPILVTFTKSGTESAGDTQCYLDGVFDNSGTAGTDTTNNADVLIGARHGDDSNGGEAFQLDAGDKVWDTRIYNRVLSPGEVYALWHPDTRFELYRQPGIGVPGFVPAVGGVNPKGPLGMPLHGPLGGPVG